MSEPSQPAADTPGPTPALSDAARILAELEQAGAGPELREDGGITLANREAASAELRAAARPHRRGIADLLAQRAALARIAQFDAQYAEAARRKEAPAAVDNLARADAAGRAQRCHCCQQPHARFGFGLPPRPTLWACTAHRAEVDTSATALGLVTP